MSFDLDIPEDFLKDLLTHDFDAVAQDILSEVSPILKKSITAELTKAVRHTGDSDLVKSVKGTKPKKTSTDAYIVNIGPSGKSKNFYYGGKKQNRKYPVSNALKAIWLNYGRQGQAPRPWLTPALNNCKSEIELKMQKIWEAKYGKS